MNNKGNNSQICHQSEALEYQTAQLPVQSIGNNVMSMTL